jgi:hypothetical protein
MPHLCACPLSNRASGFGVVAAAVQCNTSTATCLGIEINEETTQPVLMID